ncbi:MAG TPA: hypothetical protein VFI63_02635, partial [Solirubrobacterales bacterium]|nr:hypothetical protein [Solirubrobacterales bacterium]
ACGGGEAKLLPGETARQITANLDTVKQLASEGDCAGAAGAARQVSEQVEALGGVDAKLKQALRDGAARLNEVVASCEGTTTEATAPTEAETTTEKPKGKEKPKKEKPKKEAPPEATPPSLPPQANGKGKGQGNGNQPPAGEAEEPPSSGGVGAGEPAGEGH